MEVIRDLDEAIDLICEVMTPQEKLDPFAEDLCPYFGVLWPAAEGLAEFLHHHPELIKGKSILELGAGLGYPSLVALHLGAEVLTTDFHPDAGEYFLRNCRHSVVTGKFRRLNWREEHSDLGLFDVVMGSDVLYESKHPQELVRGLLRFLRPGGLILLSDPGRAYLQLFLSAAEQQGLSTQLSTQEVDGKQIFVYQLRV